MTAPVPLVQVDAFTDEPFGGNPAGVCLLPAGAWPDDGWLQSVAAEVNVAETAFLRPAGDARWDLRWFTPTVEVPLCGHATLASAHALRTEWGATADVLTFSTRSGDLEVRAAADGRGVLSLPADPPVATAAGDDHTDLLGALSVPAHEADVLTSRLFAVVVLDGPDPIDALEPDQAALAAACEHGVIVTAPGGPTTAADVVSRVFAPAVGIPEDPVTGSAHAVLAPLWAARLGRTVLACEQRSARGGQLTAALVADRVELTGASVTTLVGRLSAPAAP